MGMYACASVFSNPLFLLATFTRLNLFIAGFDDAMR